MLSSGYCSRVFKGERLSVMTKSTVADDLVKCKSSPFLPMYYAHARELNMG